MKGYVYAVQNGDLVKIGRTINPNQRIKAIQTQGGFKSEGVFISERKFLYADVEVHCHRALKEFRVIGEWFRIDFNDAVKIINKMITKYASDEREQYESVIHQKAEEKFSDLCRDVIGVDHRASGLLDIGWTQSAVNFCCQLSDELVDRIFAEAFMSPSVTIVSNDKVRIAYPGGFDEHERESYIASYNKSHIAEDSGCGVSDVPDWDAYAVYIEELHQLAA